MVDKMLRELWEIKDNIAKEYDNDLYKLASWLKKRKIAENRRVINLKAIKEIAEQGTTLGFYSDALRKNQ